MTRFVVTEVEGFAEVSSGWKNQGLSCMVIDTLWNRRIFATYRSEQFHGGGRRKDVMHGLARDAARLRAEHLNAVLAVQVAA